MDLNQIQFKKGVLHTLRDLPLLLHVNLMQKCAKNVENAPNFCTDDLFPGLCKNPIGRVFVPYFHK